MTGIIGFLPASLVQLTIGNMSFIRGRGFLQMTLSKWGFLFWRTLGIGTIVGLILGIIMKLAVKDFVFEIAPTGPYEWIFIVLGASVVACISHIGLFAYLMIRFIGMSFLKRKLLWDILQAVLMIITFIDLVYLRYVNLAQEGESIWGFFTLPILLLAVSVFVAYRKVKETNSSAWVPTLFFMFVATTLEAVPALRLDDSLDVLFTVTILVVCNAWQIMQLHRIIGTKKS
jgi:KinB signaling pathway activation protein